MAATVTPLPGAEFPLAFEDLRPYPSLTLVQGPAVEGMRLADLRTLAGELNERLPAAARVSLDPEPGRSRVTARTVGSRIVAMLHSEFVGAMRDLLAAEVLVDKVLFEVRPVLPVAGDELREALVDIAFDEDVLAGLRRRLSAARAGAVLEAVCEALALEPAAYLRRRFESWTPPQVAEWDGLRAAFFGYVERQAPGWLDTTHMWMEDELHRLVVVAAKGSQFALYASEPRARRLIAGEVAGGLWPFSAFSQVPPGTLNEAFTHGAARTLWLRGIHRRTAAKPDSKILAGTDLESALDPIGDQSFYFSAARCFGELAARKPPLSVGVAPRKSTVWTGAVPGWRDFAERVTDLLDRVHVASGTTYEPFAALAKPVAADHGDEVVGAYDMSIIAPELLVDGHLSPARRQRAERWAYDAEFFGFRAHDIADPADTGLPEDSADFSVAVAVEGSYVGRIRLRVALADHQSALVSAEPMWGFTDDLTALESTAVDDLDPDEKAHLLEEACAVCEERAWLTVRYDSGHTLSGGVLYSVRLRDAVFARDKWSFRTFADINVREEKPMVNKVDERGNVVLTKRGKPQRVFAPDQIGKMDSLFCWVWRNWPLDAMTVQRGWLACDDGPEEIADFVHFDPLAPWVTLIHVKGSSSDSDDRGVSTSDYEVVVGQAIKNLRLLDRVDLADRLEAGVGRAAAVKEAVWHNGEKSTRAKMAAALRTAGANYGRSVVVVQPRVTAGEYDAVAHLRNNDQDHSRVRRMQQLDTLLLEAEAACHGLGADFQIVGHAVAG